MTPPTEPSATQNIGTSMNPISLKIRMLQKQYNDVQIELTTAHAVIKELRELLKRTVKIVSEMEGDDFLSDISEHAEAIAEALKSSEEIK